MNIVNINKQRVWVRYCALSQYPLAIELKWEHEAAVWILNWNRRHRNHCIWFYLRNIWYSRKGYLYNVGHLDNGFRRDINYIHDYEFGCILLFAVESRWSHVVSWIAHCLHKILLPAVCICRVTHAGIEMHNLQQLIRAPDNEIIEV